MRIGLALALALGATAAAADDLADKAAVCAACHGEQGTPIEKNIPIIWGQNEGYIYVELRDMKKGVRHNEKMANVVADLDRADMLALAAWFAAKPWPTLPQPRASKSEADHFAEMARSAGCPGCHQDGYKGAGTQPKIAGQSVDYLEKTLLDFRAHVRGNNPWMTDLMQTYSPEDLAAMARVLGGM